VRPVRDVALVVGALAQVACYSYTPVMGVRPELGADVRAHLTDAGAVSLAPVIGFQIEAVTGRLVDAGDTAVVLQVSETLNRVGAVAAWNGERVTMPRAAVSRIERKSLDRRRSFVAAAIVLGVAIAAVTGFSLVGSGGNNPRSGGPINPS
jgi:hypothetical protein